MASVQVRGDGVAACCCAHLLSQAGFRVYPEPAHQQVGEHTGEQVREHTANPAHRPPLPAILISDRALDLIRDVFGRRDLLDGQPRVRKRIVAWGRGSEARTFEHSAVVVSGQSLIDAIRPRPPRQNDGDPSEPQPPSFEQQPGKEGPAHWTIFGSPPLPGHEPGHRFGSRIASAAAVSLRNHCDPAACWIESLETGWLFLIAGDAASGWLLAVGASPESLLGRSRVIAPQIASCLAPVGEFSGCPRIASRLCGKATDGQAWLACGTAAMALDPLCGDGVAHSIREAILAAAVIRAIGSGGNAAELLSHYEARMIAAFEKHLSLCLEFYRAGHGGEWWDSECRALEQGLEWCRREIGDRTRFQYRLKGFDLVPVQQ
jgi:hypothetical protein